MTDITVFGAGAFGTALAISLARDGRDVSLVARNKEHAAAMIDGRQNAARLPGHHFPETLHATAETANTANVCLIAVPTQSLRQFLAGLPQRLSDRFVVACCKGVDLKSGTGPTALIAEACPSAVPAILSGPSFAVDIAAGLPTALTLGTADNSIGKELQATLSTENLRLYRSTDIIGIELGGALKNVVAIAAGIAIGAGLGESARAALMTRGFAEMKVFAKDAGAHAETLAGLSGFGDLVLTCTSDKSRNFSFGVRLGQGATRTDNVTVEGVSTAKAVSKLAISRNIEMPITSIVARLIDNELTVSEGVALLMSRPLREE